MRLGLGKQLARPRMNFLRGNAAFGVNVNQTNPQLCPGGVTPCVVFEGSGGNPELMPYEAYAYDLSYEKYFANNRGYVSAGVFYKDFKTYVLEVLTPLDFSQLPLPAGYTGPLPSSPIGPYRSPVNLDGGKLQGYELAVSLPFDMFWAPLQGFGIEANYAYTESEVRPFEGADPITFPGLSEHVSNTTLYYERHGFSARVSHRRRTDFIGEVQGFGGVDFFESFRGEGVTDMQVGYAFNDGALDGLSLLLQVNNLENEPFQGEFFGSAQPRKYFEYGRTYLLGLNYKF